MITYFPPTPPPPHTHTHPTPQKVIKNNQPHLKLTAFSLVNQIMIALGKGYERKGWVGVFLFFFFWKGGKGWMGREEDCLSRA